MQGSAVIVASFLLASLLHVFGPTLATPIGEVTELDWGEWGECSEICGDGTQVRRRVCNPMLNPQTCQYLKSRLEWTDLIEKRECNTHACEVTSTWGPWGVWQPCSSTCGSSSFQVRRRSCQTIAALNQVRAVVGVGVADAAGVAYAPAEAGVVAPLCDGDAAEWQICDDLPPCLGEHDGEGDSKWSIFESLSSFVSVLDRQENSYVQVSSWSEP